MSHSDPFLPIFSLMKITPKGVLHQLQCVSYKLRKDSERNLFYYYYYLKNVKVELRKHFFSAFNCYSSQHSKPQMWGNISPNLGQLPPVGL